jgi:hypothetical protein
MIIAVALGVLATIAVAAVVVILEVVAVEVMVGEEAGRKIINF